MCSGCYAALHKAVRRQISSRSSINQPTESTHRQKNYLYQPSCCCCTQVWDSWRAPVHECPVHMLPTWPNTWSDSASAHASHHSILLNNRLFFFNLKLLPLTWWFPAQTWGGRYNLTQPKHCILPTSRNSSWHWRKLNSFRVRCILGPGKIDVFPYFSYNKLQQRSTDSRSQNWVYMERIYVQIRT